MGNKKRMIGALLIAGILAASSIQSFAKTDGIPVTNMGINQFENKIDKKDDAWQDKYMATAGVIKAVVPGKNGTILVDGKAVKGKLGGYDKIKLIVAPSTDIVDYETGKKLGIEVLKTGATVTAYYKEPAAKKGLPILVVAKKIIVKQAEEEYSFGIYGEVKKVSEGKDSVIAYIEGEPTGESLNDKIELAIGEQTKIVDFLTGKELAKKDIKEGIVVYGYYGEAVGMSNPPMAPAIKVVVLSADSDKKIEWATEGKIEDLKVFKNDGKTEVMILVEGKKLGDYGYDRINLLLSAKTSIVNAKDGKNLTIDYLKPGVKVNVYYDGNVTRSIPPKGNAIKIVVNE